MNEKRELVVVTAADKHYFVALISLLESLQRNSPLTNCIIFDLGLSRWQEIWLKKLLSPNIELSKLPRIPQMFDGWERVDKSGCFAWKPIVMSNSSVEHSNLVWADAGVLITRDLDDLLPILDENGIFLVCNYQHGNLSWTTEECKIAMGVSEFELSSPQIMGNFFGVSLDHDSGKKIFEEWVKFSKDPKAIKGDRQTHRHDQTILSILSARLGVNVLNHEGITTIGRFKEDYNRAIINQDFFVSHRRWINLIPLTLLKGKRRYILYLAPLLVVDTLRRFFWRAKWKLRWSLLFRKFYGIRSTNN